MGTYLIIKRSWDHILSVLLHFSFISQSFISPIKVKAEHFRTPSFTTELNYHGKLLSVNTDEFHSTHFKFLEQSILSKKLVWNDSLLCIFTAHQNVENPKSVSIKGNDVESVFPSYEEKIFHDNVTPFTSNSFITITPLSVSGRNCFYSGHGSFVAIEKRYWQNLVATRSDWIDCLHAYATSLSMALNGLWMIGYLISKWV